MILTIHIINTILCSDFGSKFGQHLIAHNSPEFATMLVKAQKEAFDDKEITYSIRKLNLWKARVITGEVEKDTLIISTECKKIIANVYITNREPKDDDISFNTFIQHLITDIIYYLPIPLILGFIIYNFY